MGLQWRRKLVVELFDMDASSGFDETTRAGTVQVFTRHKVEVVYNASFGWGADFSNVTIYNLPAEEVGKLRGYNNLGIRVYEGFLGETYYTEAQELSLDWGSVLNLMFVGKVNTIMGVKRLPNHLTQLYCIPLAGVFGQKEMALQTGKGKSVKDSVEELCKQAGFVDSKGKALVDWTNVEQDIQDDVMKGMTYTSSFIDCIADIARNHHFWFVITNNRVRLFQKMFKTATNKDPNGTFTILIDGGVQNHILMLQDVIGTPEATIGTLNISVVANSRLSVGDIIDITLLLETDPDYRNTPYVSGIVSPAQGEEILYRTDALNQAFSISSQYMIASLSHALDTHGEAWATQIQGIISTDGIADYSKQMFLYGR